MRSLKDLSYNERRDYDEAMKAARGLPAHVVAQLVNKYDRGVNYTGCAKGHVFYELVRDQGLDRPRNNRVAGGTDEWTLRDLWWGKFLDELRAAPRPKTRKQKREEQEAADQALLAKFEKMRERAGGDERLMKVAQVVADEAEAIARTAQREMAAARDRLREATREARDCHVLIAFAMGETEGAVAIAKRQEGWPLSAYFKGELGGQEAEDQS